MGLLCFVFTFSAGLEAFASTRKTLEGRRVPSKGSRSSSAVLYCALDQAGRQSALAADCRWPRACCRPKKGAGSRILPALPSGVKFSPRRLLLWHPVLQPEFRQHFETPGKILHSFPCTEDQHCVLPDPGELVLGYPVQKERKMISRLKSSIQLPRWGLRIVLPFTLLTFSGCVTEPITNRKLPMSVIPESTANQMGVQAYQQMLSEVKLSTEPRQTELVERVGRRIAAATDRRLKEASREPFQWEFRVVDDMKTVNAFALPGGKVAFYTGILPICRDENGIAVVMGHEAAHAFAEHGSHRMSIEVLKNFSLEAVQLALGGDEASDLSRLSIGVLGVGTQLGALAYSRGDESAADQIGLILMAEAGYDPREAVAFWERMDAHAGGKGPPEFLATHPSHETRIERLKELLPEAIAIYERSRSGGAAAGGR